MNESTPPAHVGASEQVTGTDRSAGPTAFGSTQSLHSPAGAPPPSSAAPVPTVFTVVLAGGVGALLLLIGLVFLMETNRVAFGSNDDLNGGALTFTGFALVLCGLAAAIMAVRSLASHQRQLRPDSVPRNLPPTVLLAGIVGASAVLLLVLMIGIFAFAGSTFGNQEFQATDDNQGIAVLLMFSGVAGFAACVATARGAAWGRIVLIIEAIGAFIWALTQLNDGSLEGSDVVILSWLILIVVMLVLPPSNGYLGSIGGGPSNAGAARQPQTF